MEEKEETLSAWGTGRNKANHSEFRMKRTRDGGGWRPHRRELKTSKEQRVTEGNGRRRRNPKPEGTKKMGRAR
jgi:hypothetical protein